MPAGRLTCLWDPAKRKTRRVALAFAEGVKAAGGEARALPLAPGRPAGPLMFYGVTPASLGTFRRAVAEGVPYWYVDNAYFGRGRYLRVTANRKQHDGLAGPRAPERLAVFAPKIRPWRIGGRNVLVTVQSEFWYVLHGTTLAAWLGETLRAIRQATDRPIVVRYKPRAALLELPNVAGVAELAQAPDGRPLEADLAEAWCLVTHASNTALEAVLAGVPVFATSPDCAARSMGLADLSQIETPHYPDDRRAWAERLAANQWTLDELRDGTCWRDLTAAGQARAA